MRNKIVRLHKIEKYFQCDNKLYAYVGNTFPSGSIKDTTVFQMLLSYKDEGILKKNSVVIEATSGNTGISLAYFQKDFNYKALIIMPKSMSIERRKMISFYGAELVLIDGGMEECEKEANKIQETIPNSFVFNQFKSNFNPLAHYHVTGPDIFSVVSDINFLFAGIGTGGTISGTSKFLKEKHPSIKTIGVEPFESPLLTKGYANSHLIQGIGANFIPSIYQGKYVDDIVDVKGEKSIETAKIIRKEENLDVGISSGAALLGALTYLKENHIIGKNIVIIFPDKGDRYSW